MFARVAKTWHLVLSAQLSTKFEPIVKQILACLDYFEVLQGYVLVSLSLVVAVDFLQTLVEQIAELLEIGRTLLKLDEPPPDLCIETAAISAPAAIPDIGKLSLKYKCVPWASSAKTFMPRS